MKNEHFSDLIENRVKNYWALTTEIGSTGQNKLYILLENKQTLVYYLLLSCKLFLLEFFSCLPLGHFTFWLVQATTLHAKALPKNELLLLSDMYYGLTAVVAI